MQFELKHVAGVVVRWTVSDSILDSFKLCCAFATFLPLFELKARLLFNRSACVWKCWNLNTNWTQFYQWLSINSFRMKCSIAKHTLFSKFVSYWIDMNVVLPVRHNFFSLLGRLFALSLSLSRCLFVCLLARVCVWVWMSARLWFGTYMRVCVCIYIFNLISRTKSDKSMYTFTTNAFKRKSV